MGCRAVTAKYCDRMRDRRCGQPGASAVDAQPALCSVADGSARTRRNLRVDDDRGLVWDLAPGASGNLDRSHGGLAERVSVRLARRLLQHELLRWPRRRK